MTDVQFAGKLSFGLNENRTRSFDKVYITLGVKLPICMKVVVLDSVKRKRGLKIMPMSLLG